MLIYASNFLWALLFTTTIEVLVVLLLCYLLKKDFRILIVSVLGNICTVPYVWFVFPVMFWYSSNLIVVSGESFAFLFEAVLYKFLGKLSWKSALVFSFVAKLTSFLLGKFLF
jgi:hypothetical protein